MILENIDLTYYVFSLIIIYIPFHIFEESLGNFPESMYKHKWIPERITYGHWMANNIFFYLPVLLLGSIIFHFNHQMEILGIGVLFWGIINFIDHLFYSIVDRKISSGFFTGILFIFISVTGLISIKNELTLPVVIISIFISVGYTIIPIVFSMIFHKTFIKIFV